jgi:peptide deformylase
MAILKIIKFPNPLLNQVSKEIVKIDAKIKKLVQDMFDTMLHAPGVGLAAIQVGEPVRLIIVDTRIKDKDTKGEIYTLINPIITKKENSTTFNESCLSVPDFALKTARAHTIYVQAQNLENKIIRFSASELASIVIQHEIDHLNGILLINKVAKKELEKYKKQLKL